MHFNRKLRLTSSVGYGQDICSLVLQTNILNAKVRVHRLGHDLPCFVLGYNILCGQFTPKGKILHKLTYKQLVLIEGDPIGTSWGEPGRFRFDSVALGFAQVGTSIALDFTVLCLPLPILSRLHLQRKRKWAVIAIFWLGSL